MQLIDGQYSRVQSSIVNYRIVQGLCLFLTNDTSLKEEVCNNMSSPSEPYLSSWFCFCFFFYFCFLRWYLHHLSDYASAFVSATFLDNFLLTAPDPTSADFLQTIYDLKTSLVSFVPWIVFFEKTPQHETIPPLWFFLIFESSMGWCSGLFKPGSSQLLFCDRFNGEKNADY